MSFTVAETIFTSLQASKFILTRRSCKRTQGISKAMQIMIDCANRIIAERERESVALRTAELANVPTFEQFQASRVELADIREAAQFETEDDKPVAGFLYMSGLWITHERNGKFWMILEQEEHEGYNLAALERKLYQYGLDSCNFD